MMYYHTGVYSLEKEIQKIHNHTLKYKTLEEDFNNTSWSIL